MFRSKLLILHKFIKAGAHWGYRNAFSQFQPYLYGFRNDIAIINSDKTIICLRRACNVIELIIRAKGHLILVNTNAEYNNIVEHTAKLTGQSFINHKWIGGLLTNWNHIHNVQRHFTQFGADLRAQGPSAARSRVSTISNRSVGSNRVERTKFAACLAKQDDQKGHEPKLKLERSEIGSSGARQAVRSTAQSSRTLHCFAMQYSLRESRQARRSPAAPSFTRSLPTVDPLKNCVRSSEGRQAVRSTAHVHAHSAESFGNSGPLQSRRQALGSLTSLEQPLYPFSVSRVKCAPKGACLTPFAPSLASQDKCLPSHQEDRDGRTNFSVESSARFKKMQKCFAGIKAKKLPDCVIILNANSNYNAICEAKLLKIPIIACVDSNVSNQLQNMITYPIPVNSESVHFIYLLCNCIYKTILYARKSTTALSVQ